MTPVPQKRIQFEPTASVECKGGTVFLHPDGYIVSDLTPGASQTWDTACEMLVASAKLLPGQKTCTMVLLNNARATREGRQAFQEIGGPLVSRVAMVVNSRVSEVTGNFFLRLNRPPYPTRLFHNRIVAADWLRPHVGESLGAEGVALLEKYA
jgi:hypothetical protein